MWNIATAKPSPRSIERPPEPGSVQRTVPFAGEKTVVPAVSPSRRAMSSA
jgi:hypothetical protein